MLKTPVSHKTPKTLREKPQWTLLLLLLAGVSLGALSLLFAFGNYSWDVFRSYFAHPLILLLNLLPVVLLVFVLYFLFGRAWCAFLTASVVVMGFTLADYYMLRLRDDPLYFADLLNAKEAAAITVTQGYDLTPDRRVWFGLICVVLGTAALALLARWRGGAFRRRALLALIPAALLIPTYLACASDDIYVFYAVNNDATNQWAETQTYLSRGFVYPFLHSISSDTLDKPEHYSAADVQALLAQYQDADISAEKRVNLIAIQLEAFADFSGCGAEGVDWEKAYAAYHDILSESYHGPLMVNVFAGGTVNTERCFLTGYAQLKNFRSKTNSYAWYLADQGYAVTGSHPGYEWFYNRENINAYLGFLSYNFFENHYSDLTGGTIASDGELLPEIYDLYRQAAASGQPVFSFNVTYQGHGPYSTSEVWRGTHYTDGRYSAETTNILDNYLGSVQDTAEQLSALLARLREDQEPVVVLLYGDHKPWLGDSDSAYGELGISLDTSDDAGLYNKYTTEYVIWANDAAKAVTGGEFSGEGAVTSPNYLMDLLFEQCGWQGNAYMQAMRAFRQELPVVTTVGRYLYHGEMMKTATMTDTAQARLEEFRALQYYEETAKVD
jgi:hypothetical protein